MDNIASSGVEQERQVDTHPAALLVIVIDTNPSAWAELHPYIRIDRFLADIIVFVNAHLACNHANRIAVLASHCASTAWLYPSSENEADEANGTAKEKEPPPNPNKYRPFAIVEQTVRRNIRRLFANTTPDDVLNSADSTSLASTLSTAIGHISRVSQPATSQASTSYNPETIGQQQGGAEHHTIQNARILLASTSGNLAAQYIPLMNLIFASQHLRIPLDILKLAGDTVLLQQASYTTQGIFLNPIELPANASTDPDTTITDTARSSNGTSTPSKSTTQTVQLLPLLLFAFLPDPATRRHLIPPTAIAVDFRAACFCHRRVVDIGFVCSICLSIFCDEGVSMYLTGQVQNGAQAGIEGGTQHGAEGGQRAEAPPKGTGLCLTCGTPLSLKVLGGAAAGEEDKPRKKKKKKRREGEAGVGGSGAGTPASS